MIKRFSIQKVHPLFAAAFSFIFFLILFLTIDNYGISWDEPIHFLRGQGYLHYFLTGEVTYETIQGKRSYWENGSLPADYFLENDSGHPPLNGILASLTNFIFYKQLGIIGDIAGYHLFNILASTLLVFIVVLFASEKNGLFAGTIAGLTAASYPLFFAESHFNIKDPPEAAFFGLTIFTFWKSVEKGSWKWLLASSIGFAAALGTKFNILFLPFIVAPYLLIKYYSVIKDYGISMQLLKRIPKGWLVMLCLSPIVVLILFFGTWPFLWQDLMGNFLKIFKYYTEIGINAGSQPGYFIAGFNLFPIVWILFTTPPLVLLLMTAGIFATLTRKSEDRTEILWLLWFIVPIARVSLPHTTIYGGVRQIMEFVPAMALLAGLGANELLHLVQKLKIKYQNYMSKFKIVKLFFLNLKLAFLFLLFACSIYPIIKLHPNENVYFNLLVGGIAGAKRLDIPFWGNSFGNAYWQAVQWLNQNAEKNARVALVQGTNLNIALIQFRSDIKYSNYNWSGINRGGEYLIELTHQDSVRLYPYAWGYIEKFLEPVYEVKVDGVAIAKVWKNDIEHTKVQMRLQETKHRLAKVSVSSEVATIEIGEEVVLSRIKFLYGEPVGCSLPRGNIYTSMDSVRWDPEPDSVPLAPQAPENNQRDVTPNSLTFFFPGRRASFIKFVADDPNSCILRNPTLELIVLK